MLERCIHQSLSHTVTQIRWLDLAVRVPVLRPLAAYSGVLLILGPQKTANLATLCLNQ